MRTRTVATLALISALVLPDRLATLGAESEAPTPLFNGHSLDGWVVRKGGAKKAVAVEGVLRVSGPGSLETQEAYDDFVLTFEARPVGHESVGGVLVRGLVGFKHTLAYEVQVASGQRPSPVVAFHVDDGPASPVRELAADAPADGVWHHYRIECVGDRIRVWRDGTAVVEAPGVPVNTGRIGVRVKRGVVELRHIELQKVDDPRPPRLCSGAEGVFEPGSDGIISPRLVREVKPDYTSLALKLGVQGDVWLRCIVETDGHVEQCAVVRRLFGELDAQALLAAQRWRFEPGTKNGEPVAVRVTLSMGFMLR